MDPALLLLAAAPAPCPGVFPRQDPARARNAADARIALLVKQVERDVVAADEGPHLLARPERERVHLHEPEGRVPLEDPHAGALAGLIPANRAHPCLEGRESLAQRKHFPHAAAAFGLALPEAIAEDRGLLRDGLLRAHPANGQAVTGFQAPPELVRLREEKAGVEGEDVDAQAGARDEVDQEAALDAEPGRERHPRKAMHGLSENFLRRRIDEQVGERVELCPTRGRFDLPDD